MTDYDTHWGTIHRTIECKDDWDNIVIYHQDNQRIVKLQKPAILSFKEQEKRVGTHINKPNHIIRLTGEGWRSCALQRELHNSDPARFADPNGSLHTQGLAIDLDTNDPYFEDNKRALLNHGWHFPRPDEIWHVSFRISG